MGGGVWSILGNWVRDGGCSMVSCVVGGGNGDVGCWVSWGDGGCGSVIVSEDD